MHNQDPKPSNFLVLFFTTALLAILIGKLIVNDQHPDLFLYIYGIVVTLGIIILLSVRYLFYRDPYHLAQTIHKDNPELQFQKPFVSVMVAAFNEEQFITTCVDSLLNQTYRNYEVIVVNDASTDKTIDVLKQYADNPRVKVIDLKQNQGKKHALAEAMLQAKGSVFIFTDSDSIITNEAIERTVKIFTALPMVGGISGHTRANNADTNLLTRIQDTWYEGQFSVRKAYESVFGSVTCVSGPFAAFRREAVFNLIPYWINDSFLGSEFKFATDRTKTALVLANPYYMARVTHDYPTSPFVTKEHHTPNNWLVVYAKSIRAYTNVPDFFPSFIKQQVRWKKSFIRNIFLTGRFYWRRPLPAAFMYYLRGLFVFLGPFIVFRHLVWLPLNGDAYSGLLYLSGILFVGFTFATLHKIEHPNEQVWIYRPLMNLISTFVLSWLIFYSLATVKKMTWHRG